MESKSGSWYNSPSIHCCHSRQMIGRTGFTWMPPDDSKLTSKNDPSQSSTPSYEEWWAEQGSLSARRKWSPERRKSRAKALRLMRRLKKTGMLGDMSKKTIKVGDEIITIVCRLPEPPDDDRRKP